ncbi:MAG: tRNA (pseudouridine(54)-N(1))-methyltransferase TrmY [Thermoplasmata archaeon]
MRRILLLIHRVPVQGEFTLNDLAGGGGRMDEVARAVSTGFTLSNDLRRDTEMTLLFAGMEPHAPRRIRIEGARLRHLNPDERSTAALLKNALVRSSSLDHDIESSPGIWVGPIEPNAELERVLRLPGAVWLAESGMPLRSYEPPEQGIVAVLSDPIDPTVQEQELLERSGVPRLSVGPHSLRTSQVVDILHNECDLRLAKKLAVDPVTS